jgi:SAM-dependent methyltransferase
MHALSYGDKSFDLIIHSDTLEHLERPVRALEECCRILGPGGRVCFTVPIIVGRLTRGRAGLAKSYHGDPSNCSDTSLFNGIRCRRVVLPDAGGIHPRCHQSGAAPGCARTIGLVRPSSTGSLGEIREL